jgi:hypothetical protein
MEQKFITIRIKGKNTRVPCCQVDGKVVVVRGKWIKTASVHEEEWMKGAVVTNPEYFVAELKKQKLPADVLTFVQKLPDTKPKFHCHFDYDNYAVIHIKSYDDWWEKLPQESRKNTRRSAKRGVTVRTVEVDDTLIQGITEIYNETPIRQGKPFPHYGKDFATIKNEACTLLDRSEFIGAYHGNELIGFIKLVYMGDVASILHIVSKNAHYDKRPTNILIAKAVEICYQKGVSYLIYGRHTYGKKTSSPLIVFKERNGFQKMQIPRYYVPVTLWGWAVVALRLYRGLLGLLPSAVVNFLVTMRSKFFDRASAKAGGPEKFAIADRDEAAKAETADNVHLKRIEKAAEV